MPLPIAVEHPIALSGLRRCRLPVFVAAALAGLSWATGCGDGTTEPPTLPPDAPRPTTVTITPATARLTALGATEQFTAVVRDQSGQVMTGAEVTWASSNTSVATVSGSGLVTAAGNGTATITATAGDAFDTAEITVTSPDRAVLVALYNATDGPNWVNSDNWLTDAPLGDWHGVDTDGAGRVVRLDLSGLWDSEFRGYTPHGLRGPIPPELGKLANLRFLSLYNNNLTGPIPPELGDLATLRGLSLYNNDLTGPVPSTLANLARLEGLDVFGNDLSGPIPPELGSLASLTRLQLGSNSLSGPIPPELGRLANLRRLSVLHNQLTGPIPPELWTIS
ncbi:MAG: hypothetical protein F4X15_16085 [Gemmatimonadetes bacterium]|nr:hypothetical protein [Gemmatimonadota bacterium]